MQVCEMCCSQGRAEGEHVLYMDRIRIENAKFTNTFISSRAMLIPGKSDDPGAASSFISRHKKTARGDKENEWATWALDVPCAAMAPSSVQASSDYRLVSHVHGLLFWDVVPFLSRSCTHSCTRT
jgi:hypothetical protein